MAEWILCPKCKHVVDKSKKICDVCGYVISNSEIEKQEECKKIKIEKETGRGIFSSIAIVVMLIMMCLFYITYSNTNKTKILDSKSTTTFSQPGVPYQFAKKFVINRLKAPSTAKFPNITEARCVILSDNKTWKIFSYVDSQNSFGAMVRTKWYVKIIDTGESWKLLDITFYEN